MRKCFNLVLLLLLLLLLSSCGILVDKSTQPSGAFEETNITEETSQTIPDRSNVDWLISEYNSIADEPITCVTEFDVKNTENGHYRTEFRLGAFDNAKAKTGKIGSKTIDIIAYGYSIKTFGYSNEHLRIYVSGLSAEQVKEMITVFLPILNNSLTDTEIEEVLRKVDENGEVNGYCGGIGITWISGNLMLKVE